MKSIVKQAVGIDCGKLELVASIGYMNSDFQTSIKATAAFTNDEVGLKKLVDWTGKYTAPNIKAFFVAEPTGVYHERLCYYLASIGYNISVVLPNRAASFLKTLKGKTINDRIAASGLAIMDLEKTLDLWLPPMLL